MQKTLVAALVCASAGALVAPAASAPAPTPAACGRFAPVVRSLDPRPRAPRVFAMQFRQEAAKVTSMASFRHAVDCQIRRQVLPNRAHGRPNVVVFDEDTGLMTIATGAAGAPARALLMRKGAVPGCEGQGFPCATLKALGLLNTGYSRQLAFYGKRYPALSSLIGKSFVAATDVFVRGFMQTFSDLARRYRIYLVASNTQAPFRLSTNQAEISALAAPDRPRPRSVYVATQGVAYNHTFIWAPRNVRRGGAAPMRNLVKTNLKVPLTSFESALGFGAGPSGGAAARANLLPYRVPGTGARLGIATSLPAFEYGPPVPAARTCDDVTVTYMRCLNSLGANVMLQPDANDGAWSGADADPSEMWQPLSWMNSAWRAVSDPSVSFSYAVNSFLVGNLADTPFDGQSAILQRGLRGKGCNYVGNRSWVAGEDRPDLQPAAGPKSQFLALAPWIAPDGGRAGLRAAGARLLFGTGGAGENAYRQSAVIADLPFPVDQRRRACAG